MEKRYYWLKLSEDFFKDKAIMKLRNIAGGDTYTIIYLKMMLLAIRQDNKLYYDGIELTFSDEIALEIGEDPENVRMTLQYLLQKNLIEEITDDEIYLSQCEEMVGSETDAARRKRVSRNRQKLRELEQAEVPLIPEIPEEPIAEEKPVEPKKPKTETCMQIYERVIDEYMLPTPIEDKLREWIEYKVERRDAYKEKGLRALLKKVQQMTQLHGIEPICDLIDTCMSSNWKGIIWDRLEKGHRQTGGYVQKIENRVSDVDNW